MRPKLIWINGHYGLKRKGYQHVGSKAVKISVILTACAKSQETRRERGMEGGFFWGEGGWKRRQKVSVSVPCTDGTSRISALSSLVISTDASDSGEKGQTGNLNFLSDLIRINLVSP